MPEYRCDTPANHTTSSEPCHRCEPIYNTLVVTPDGDRYRCSEPRNHHPVMNLSDSPCWFCREEEEAEAETDELERRTNLIHRLVKAQFGDCPDTPTGSFCLDLAAEL